MITEEKLKKLEDPVVIQVLFDILHMKSSKFPDMNVGQHSDYKEIVEELKNRYLRNVNVQKYRNERLLEKFRDQDRA